MTSYVAFYFPSIQQKFNVSMENKLGLSWAKLSLSWGYEPQTRVGAELGKSNCLDGWFAKIGFNDPITNRVKVWRYL